MPSDKEIVEAVKSAAEKHLKLAAVYEKSGNVSGGMQLRAVSNLLYAILARAKFETILLDAETTDEPDLRGKIDLYTNGRWPYEIREDAPWASWYFKTTSDGKTGVVAVITKKEIQKAFDSLTEPELAKYFADPFYGIIPHEYNEGVVAGLLMLGKLQVVKKKYPKYKFSNFELKFMKEHKLSNLNSVMGYMQDLPTELTNFGGIAHDVVISENKSKYDDWIEETS